MKTVRAGKISTIVLWICMFITVGIFIFFYFELIKESDNAGLTGSGMILNWLYLIFILVLSVTGIFSFAQLFFRWRKKNKSIVRPLAITGALVVLLFCTYWLGNGNPLPILGYEGKENTSFWLKLTDMWLYSLYILLTLVILALFGGIIWSYFKRTK
jgi:CDP-diglyceride synthetase